MLLRSKELVAEVPFFSLTTCRPELGLGTTAYGGRGAGRAFGPSQAGPASAAARRTGSKQSNMHAVAAGLRRTTVLTDYLLSAQDSEVARQPSSKQSR